MKCTVCGGMLQKTTTDLPFKINQATIVIAKELPVYQCANCPEYLIEDQVLAWFDGILANLKGETELEVVRYAA